MRQVLPMRQETQCGGPTMKDKQFLKNKIMDNEYPENNVKEELANTKNLEIGKAHNREILIRQARANLVKNAQNEFAILMQELMDSSDEEK